MFPLVLYLSSARLWNENKSSSDIVGVYSRTDAYTRCLDKTHGTELVFGYIKMLQSVAVEENDGRVFPAYNAILDAVNIALCDELGTGESVIFSTRYGRDIVALKTIEGTIVPFTALSDGYRNVIKIVLEIAARMCILNPYLQGDALKNTPGVVGWYSKNAFPEGPVYLRYPFSFYHPISGGRIIVYTGQRRFCASCAIFR